MELICQILPSMATTFIMVDDTDFEGLRALGEAIDLHVTLQDESRWIIFDPNGDTMQYCRLCVVFAYSHRSLHTDLSTQISRLMAQFFPQISVLHSSGTEESSPLLLFHSLSPIAP